MNVDPLAVLAALGVIPVTGGQDTLIWRVERKGQANALRVFRSDQHEAARREAVAMESAASTMAVPT